MLLFCPFHSDEAFCALRGGMSKYSKYSKPKLTASVLVLISRGSRYCPEFSTYLKAPAAKNF